MASLASAKAFKMSFSDLMLKASCPIILGQYYFSGKVRKLYIKHDLPWNLKFLLHEKLQSEITFSISYTYTLNRFKENTVHWKKCKIKQYASFDQCFETSIIRLFRNLNHSGTSIYKANGSIELLFPPNKHWKHCDYYRRNKGYHD